MEKDLKSFPGEILSSHRKKTLHLYLGSQNILRAFHKKIITDLIPIYEKHAHTVPVYFCPQGVRSEEVMRWVYQNVPI
ncbi:MAG TPA: hypothetical protein VEM15_15385 [Thermodesulfobacteriota bacterium]|nr:hypothetical protein [Thermodesulfobacteriota bacterium]